VFTSKIFRRSLIFLAPALTLQTLIFAQAGWWKWQNPLPQGNPLYAISFSDARRGLAVGRDGTILRTETGGRQWEVVRGPVNTPLYGLAMRGRRGTKQWAAVGARGVVLISGNNGGSWAAAESGTKKHLFAVTFANEQRGWAVGVEGTIISTEDGGATWKAQASGVSKHLSAVAFSDEKHGVAVGEAGTLLVTEDGGGNWRMAGSPVMHNLLGAAAVAPDKFWVVGWQGAVLYSGDAGRTWAAQASNTSGHLQAVNFLDAKRGWAAGVR
jgi:photosystem II stability/assembly factor-like uncharacterized protein